MAKDTDATFAPEDQTQGQAKVRAPQGANTAVVPQVRTAIGGGTGCGRDSADRT
jgi:hypothetical protein